MELQHAQIRAAAEAERLRRALRKTPRGETLLMVVAPAERAEIWSHLSELERKRIKLLESWPWDLPALVSSRAAAG